MSDTDNVINMPTPLTVLADRIRAAYGRTERGREEWIEGTLELAVALADARGRFKADREFSHWLVDAGFEHINDHDRAALIRMADDLGAARIVLEETKRLSWRYIWDEEMSPRFGHVAKPNLPEPIPENPPSNPEPEAKVPEEAAPPTPPTKPISKRSPFHGWKRAEEVVAIYRDKETRALLGKVINGRSGKDIWALILEAIDAGFPTVNHAAVTNVTLRILFPHSPLAYCRQFDLTSTKVRQHVRAHIMPAAIANRDAVLADPEQLEAIVAAHWQRVQDETREAAAKEKVDNALRAMAPDEQEIVMFGVRLWPRVEHKHGTYDYDQLCTAIWYFRDFDGWIRGSLSGQTVGSRAIITKQSTRWPSEYADRAYPIELRAKIKKVYSLVHVLAHLLQDNPDGECIVPVSPKN